MSRRTKLLLIILVGILLVLLGLYIFFQPYLASRKEVQQPPALPSDIQPSLSGSNGSSGKTATPQPRIQQPPPTPEQQKLNTLENKASAAVERIGSGASGDGFLGYADAMNGMTAKAQAAALASQQALQKAHPATGPQYGMTTHAVASHIRNGRIGDAKLVATVDAIQTTDAGDPSKPTSVTGKTVTVTFVKQADETYLIDSLVWEDRAI